VLREVIEICHHGAAWAKAEFGVELRRLSTSGIKILNEMFSHFLNFGEVLVIQKYSYFLLSSPCFKSLSSEGDRRYPQEVV
jgi:hypothetical protein